MSPSPKKNIDFNQSELFFCPQCRESLHSIQNPDIFLETLECSNEHRFTINLMISEGLETAKASDLVPPDLDSDVQIIQFWLTKFNYRSKLNDQLAQIIRRIGEIYSNEKKISVDSSNNSSTLPFYSYCPLCKSPLVVFDQRNAWVLGLKCKNNHEFLQRDGIRFIYKGKKICFREYLSEASVISLTHQWLRENQPHSIQIQLNNQIRRVLKNFQKRMAGDVIK